MSFVLSKNLICSFCGQQTMTSEENFPDDLHDALRRYNVPQILWICRSCKRDKMPSSKTQISDEIEHLKAKVCKLDSDMICVKDTEIRELRSALQEVNSNVNFMMNYMKQSLNEKNNVLKTNEDAAEMDSMDGMRKITTTPTKCNLSGDSLKRNKTALTMLHDILKTQIKIDETQAAKSAKIVNSFIVDTLIPALSMDSLFGCLYKTIYYTGSSYNDLRISEATEYDINIILDVPKQISLVPEFFQDTSTFAKIKWNSVGEIPAHKACVEKFLLKVSESGILDPSKISSWFQGIIDRFILSKPKICDVKEIRSFKSGPAQTVQLSTIHDYSITIDLVPVFEFNYSTLKGTPISDILSSFPVEKSKEFWFLVPKSCKGEQLMLAHETKLSWRMHLPEVERVILHNKQCAKPIIKLLKLLRDKLNWNSQLSSYYCTTVILWELSKNQDVEYWSGTFLFERFLEALKCLVGYFNQKKLPYFFNPEYNLFHSLNESLCNNSSNRLNRIILSIEGDISSLKNHFFQSSQI